MNCVHGVRMDRNCMQCGNLNGPTTTEPYEAEVARLRERNREVTGALGTALRERDAARLEAGRLAQERDEARAAAGKLTEQVVELTGKLVVVEVEVGRLRRKLSGVLVYFDTGKQSQESEAAPERTRRAPQPEMVEAALRRYFERNPDVLRCTRCGWPLSASVREGCTADSCSMRPMPDVRQDLVAHNARAREALEPKEVPGG